MKTDFPDSNEITPTSTSTPIKEIRPFAQELSTKKDPLVLPKVETFSNDIKPLFNPDSYKITNLTYFKFLFPKVFQHGICGILLYFKPEISELIDERIELNTFSIILGSISGFIFLLCIGILKGVFYNHEEISKILLFVFYFFVTLSVNSAIFICSLFVDYEYTLYYPFFYISGICLIISLCLLCLNNSLLITTNILLSLGIAFGSLWFIFLKGKELMLTLIILTSIFIYYMIFCYRIKKIEKYNTTAMCQYNMIFYSAVMSNCWLLIVILGIPVFIVILLLIGCCCGWLIGDSNYKRLWKFKIFWCLFL